jgi:hypothetical protein
MTDIVDLNERRRNAAEGRPDPDCILKDGFGREMFKFALSYDLDGKEFGLNVWAYSTDDAKERVEAMRASLRLDGQVFAMVPA